MTTWNHSHLTMEEINQLKGQISSELERLQTLQNQLENLKNMKI